MSGGGVGEVVLEPPSLESRLAAGSAVVSWDGLESKFASLRCDSDVVGLSSVSGAVSTEPVSAGSESLGWTSSVSSKFLLTFFGGWPRLELIIAKMKPDNNMTPKIAARIRSHAFCPFDFSLSQFWLGSNGCESLACSLWVAVSGTLLPEVFTVATRFFRRGATVGAAVR